MVFARIVPLALAVILLATSVAPASAPESANSIALARSMDRTPGLCGPRENGSDNRTFYTYETMTARLKELAAEYSDIVKLYDLTSMIDVRFGFKTTWQGRTVWGVRISSSPVFNDPDRPKIIVEGSHHAREWMGFTTAMDLVEILVNSYKSKTDFNCSVQINGSDWSAARMSWLVDNRDIWVIPMVNPDGVTLDQQMMAAGTGSWRKTLRDNNNNGQFDADYDGVDINRNYPWMWCHNLKRIVTLNGVSVTQDSSYPGSEQYHGPQDNYDDDGDSRLSSAPDWWVQKYGADWNGIDEDPMDGLDNDGDGKMDEDRDGGFSEPETCAVEALFNALDSDGKYANGRSDISIAVSLHAYTGCVMWPWGYTHEKPPHAPLMEEIGTKMASFARYDAYSADQMYLTSGDTADWFYAAMGTLPFVIELGTGQQGGFHPKPEMMDNISMPNVQALLYCAERADEAKDAFDQIAPSLDIGTPGISHVPTKTLPPGEDYQVVATIGNATNLAPNGLSLCYRVNGGPWQKMTMRPSGPNFAIVIPGQGPRDTIEYYIGAKDVFNNTHSLPSYAPYSTFRVKVTGELSIVGISVLSGALLLIPVAVVIRFRWTLIKAGLGRLSGAQKK